MNEQLKSFAKEQIKIGLGRLPERSNELFKLMYGRNPDVQGNAQRSVEDTMSMTIEEVLQEITDDKLDLAMQQIQNTLEK